MIDELINALENYQEAKLEYSKAAENCHYDRDYFLHYEKEKVNKAKEELSKIFKNSVASIVAEIINIPNN